MPKKKEKKSGVSSWFSWGRSTKPADSSDDKHIVPGLKYFVKLVIKLFWTTKKGPHKTTNCCLSQLSAMIHNNLCITVIGG
jgi:hypothetical protein